MRDRQKSADLIKAFRETRHQVQKKQEQEVAKPMSRGYSPSRTQKRGNSSYESFLEKYNNLEENIGSFKTFDFMFFFREKAKESGVKYVIASQQRDAAIFKKMQGNYSPEYICLMIEFLFQSEQNYLDKGLLQPTVLVSSWCNKIYHDSLLWVEDKYFPEQKKKSPLEKREWSSDSDNSTKIGEW